MRLLSLALVCACSLLAQNAQVSGVVKDPTDAVIPNATVTIANQDTGAERVAATNAEGLYSAVALNPGRYQVRATASGFQTSTLYNVILEVAQTARLDFTLEVGRAEQSVSVDADATPINLADASVSMTISQQLIANLPLNGRS